MSERILIVRLAALGDIATASTIVTRLRAERPDAHITWLCGNAGRMLVELFGVDQIIGVDERRLLRGNTMARGRALVAVWATLAGKRFDLAVVAHADRRYRLLLRTARVRRLHMLNRREHGSMNPIPGRFFGDEYARLIDGPRSAGPRERSYEVADVRPRLAALAPPAHVPLGSVVIAPGGARNILRDDPLRRWPVERYADVARRLLQLGIPVTLIGDAGDAWVRPAFAGVPIHDAIGALDLTATLRLMCDARLVISHDTGPIHLARLVRSPLLALFGPTSPRQVLGSPPDTEALWGGKHLACRPCFDGRDFAACCDNVCIKDISVDTVIAHAEHMLAAPIRHSHA